MNKNEGKDLKLCVSSNTYNPPEVCTSSETRVDNPG